MNVPESLDLDEIIVLRDRVPTEALRRLLAANYVDTVKFVVDLGREVIAIGGVMHADAVAVLLQEGSVQSDFWGTNYLPGQSEWLQFTSLINIRPAHGNASMEVADPAVRTRIRALVERLIGSGAAL